MPTDGAGSQRPQVEPRLVACAWCAPQGRPAVAVRPPDTRRWHDGSLAFARALKAAGFASHGVGSEKVVPD